MGRRNRATALLVVISLAVLAVYLIFGERVTGASLSHSVASKVGPSFFGSCRRVGGSAWTCAVMPTDGSATGISYAVTAPGRCWTGSQVANGGLTGLPPRITGCITVMDQFRLDDHIGSGTKFRRPGFY